jgi:hypothetical protein
MVFVDLIWSGTPVSSETLYTWELEPMTVGAETSPLTLRDVIDRHGGEIWYQRDKAAHNAFSAIVLPAAAASDAIAADQVPSTCIATAAPSITTSTCSPRAMPRGPESTSTAA